MPFYYMLYSNSIWKKLECLHILFAQSNILYVYFKGKMFRDNTKYAVLRIYGRFEKCPSICQPFCFNFNQKLENIDESFENKIILFSKFVMHHIKMYSLSTFEKFDFDYIWEKMKIQSSYFEDMRERRFEFLFDDFV